MKNPLHYIQSYPHRTKQILGISYDQFVSLVQHAEMIHQKRKAVQEKIKVRVNAPGGGRKPKLTIPEEICLTLFYLRQMLTFEILGMQFDLSKTEANDTFHYWLSILGEVLPASMLKQYEKQEGEYKIVQELLRESELIVDSTEQPRSRPVDNEEQKKYYSGKKKNHTFKNQIVSLPKGKDIVDVVAGERGPVSDISLFRRQQENFDPEQSFKGDKAYIGGKNIETPHKKPRNGELTAEQKEENKSLSSNRIFVEHLIIIIKIFRIASLRFRLKEDTYEQIILTVCGLVRLRIGSLVLPNLS